MDEPIGIGNRDRFSGNTDEFTLGDYAAYACHGVFAHTTAPYP
jgi:hypothetical protein